MANRPATVTENEIKRSVKGVLAAGFAVGHIEVDHKAGKVLIYPAGAVVEISSNPCDRLLK